MSETDSTCMYIYAGSKGGHGCV